MKRTLIILFILWSFGPSLQAQNQPESGSVPYQELVYLHLNQTLFLSGDTVWAGIQVLESESLLPGQLSQIVYLELWGQGGKSVLRKRVLLDESTGMGFLALPNSLASGHYLVRAYTRWMRNGPESQFFRHWIRVVNPVSPPSELPADTALSPYDVEFVVEGGQLLIDQPAVVHLRTTGWNGVPVSTDGEIRFFSDGVQKEAVLVAQYQTDEKGYAQVEFTPDDAWTYQLSVKTQDSTYQTMELGQASTTGFSMRLVDDNQGGAIHVLSGIDQETVDLRLLVFQRGRELDSRRIRTSEGGEETVRISNLTTAPGANQLMLVNENGDKLAERFILADHPNRSENTAMLPDALSSENQSTMLELSGATFPNTDLKVRYSMMRGYAGHKAMGLWEYLHAAAGLPQAEALSFGPLDWLELDQMIVFQQSGEEEALPASLLAPETHGVLLAGIMRDERRQPLSGQEVFLSFPGEKAWVHRALTDRNGTFSFILEPAVGQPEVTILRGGEGFRPDWTISLESAFADGPDVAKWPVLTITADEWSLLERHLQYRQLQQRYLDPEQSQRSTGGIGVPVSFYGIPDHVYRFSDYTTMPTEEAFIEFIPEGHLRNRNGQRVILLHNETGEQLFPGPPFQMIDGVPVNTSSQILDLSYRLVDRIEIVNHSFLLNGQQYNGLLNLITYQQDASSVVLKDGELRLNLLLFQDQDIQARHTLTGDRVPELNEPGLLLWDALSPGDHREISVKYSDRTDGYELRLEGVSADGLIWSGKVDLLGDR